MNAPDYASPLVGWRVWKIVEGDDGPALCSVVYQALWTPGEPLEASCRSYGMYEEHETPCDPCPHDPGCGIYSCTEVGKIRQYLNGQGKPGDSQVAFGLLNSWGTVVECTMGYRAKFAYPRQIFLPCDSHRYAKGLDVYGVPVHCVGDTDRYQALMRVAREIEHGRGSSF